MGGHGYGQRNMNPAHLVFIDEPGVNAEVQYRLLYTCHPSYRIYLNREFSIDSDGDAGGVSTAEYRCSSVLNVQELWIP